MVQHYVSKYKTWQFLEHKIEISKYWVDVLLQNYYTRLNLIKADIHVVCIPAGLQDPVLTVAVMTLSNPEAHDV